MSESLSMFQKFMECQLKNASAKGAQDEANQLPQPFVTISRQTGAGGTTVGKLLVDYLKEHDKQRICPWTFMDKSIVAHILDEHHLPQDVSKYMSEKKVSEIQDIVDSFFDLHPPAFALVKKTSETLLHLAQMGHCILVGRGGNIVTRQLPGGVHVRLIGSVSKRTLHAQEFYHLNPVDAAKKVKDEDEGRRDYVKQNFNNNIDEPLLYDMVLNTDHISFELAAKMIGDVVLGRLKKITAKA